MKSVMFFLILGLSFCVAQDTRLSNDSSPLNEPAHIISVVVLEIGETSTQKQVEEQLLQLNRMLDYKRIQGYQPLRLKLEQYQHFKLADLNSMMMKQCEETEPITLDELKSGYLTKLRSLRFLAHPNTLMVYVLPSKVDENFREQSMEPLSASAKMDDTLTLGPVESAYENDYVLISSNFTLARSFGKYLTLADAWDEDSNIGQSTEDVSKNGSWKKGQVDARADRNNAMDVAQAPFYFTVSQLKVLYQAFLDRQGEDYVLKEEKGKAFFLDAEDLYRLGKRHHEYQEYEKALKYFQQALKAGSANAAYAIGYLHDNQLIENASESIAIKYYNQASEKGVVQAQFRLGLIYESGFGQAVKADIEVAQKYWKLAADQGHPEAKDKLDFYQGMKPIPSSQAGSYYSQGMHAYYDGDFLKAVKCFYLSSMHKHEEATYFLGLCYYEGKGIPQNLPKSKELWESIAEKSPQAQYGMGLLFFYGGAGIEQDLETSYEWFTRASEGGHSGAKEMLKQFE